MLISYIRSAILFFVLILSVRLMGKRQIGEMEPSEFVITMLLANLAAVPMQDNGIPLLSGLIPILTVLALELVVAYLCLKSIRLRRLFCGVPMVLVQNGKICQENLRKTRITLDELTEHLREHDVLELESVKYAILETNGEISTFLYGKDRPPTARECGIRAEDPSLPYTIISDGRLMQENLRMAGYSRQWLDETLQKRNCTIERLFLFTVDETGKQCFVLKEEGQ